MPSRSKHKVHQQSFKLQEFCTVSRLLYPFDSDAVLWLVTRSYRLFVTPWTEAHQASLSMGFSRQESWSQLPCPPPADLYTLGSNAGLPYCRHILSCLSINQNWNLPSSHCIHFLEETLPATVWENVYILYINTSKDILTKIIHEVSKIYESKWYLFVCLYHMHSYSNESFLKMFFKDPLSMFFTTILGKDEEIFIWLSL